MILEEIRELVVQQDSVIQVCGNLELHDALLAFGYVWLGGIVHKRPLRCAVQLAGI